MKKILLVLCKQEFTRLDVICFSISSGLAVAQYWWTAGIIIWASVFVRIGSDYLMEKMLDEELDKIITED